MLGQAVAAALQPFGFPVAGWSRTRRTVAGVTSYAGDDELGAFLAGTRVLVCLLPATAATADLLDAATLSLLPRGAEVVNIARGSLLVDADLLALQERDVGGHADDLAAGQRLGEPPQRRRAVVAVDDELGDHRVVVGRDLVAGTHAGVDAHAGLRRRGAQVREGADLVDIDGE